MEQRSGSLKLILSIVIALLIVGGAWYLTRRSPEDKKTLEHVTSSDRLISDSIDDSSSSKAETKKTTAKQTTTTKKNITTNTTTAASKTTTTKKTTVVTTKAPSITYPATTSPILSYYSLNSAEKEVYYALSDAIKNGTSNIPINVSITSGQLSDVYYLAKNLNYYSVNAPMSFTYSYYSQSGVITAVKLDFPFSKSVGDSKTAALKSKVNSIKASIPKTSDYDKVKYIHDYIINHCRYNTNAVSNSDAYPTAFTAYGALVEGSAVCEGYAKAFSLLCNEVGVEALLVTGKGSNQPHMWNMVKCNGQWYHMDVTWDDPVSQGGEDSLQYTYFNVTTAQITKDHVIDNTSLNVPLATATAANYYYYNGLVASSYTQAKTIVLAEAKKNTSSGEKVIRIKAANLSVKNEIYSKMLCNNGDIFQILGQALGSKTFSSVQSSSSANYEIDIHYTVN